MDSNSFQNINIVLVMPKRAANVGAVARTMNCMGFKNLILVAPRCKLDSEAYNLAVGSAKILDEAITFDTMEEATGDSSLVIGTTRRNGKRRHNFLTLHDFANELLPKHASQKISVVFGPEDYGLSAEQLKACQYLVYIPTEKEFGSLNLAHAVTVVAYELRMAILQGKIRVKQDLGSVLATPEKLALLSEILNNTIKESRYPERSRASSTGGKLMEILTRANLSEHEATFIMGLARHVNFMSDTIWGKDDGKNDKYKKIVERNEPTLP